MSYFNEENTVEQLVLDTLTDQDNQWCATPSSA
jgi:type I restriction enzyme, R subunit